MPREPKKEIEEIVKKLGRYPIDAFAFVQECLGIAANTVHGSMSDEEKAVAQWMAHNDLSIDDLRVSSEQGELPMDIADALKSMGGVETMNRHVTGEQLCWAIRDTALKQWGMMARSVLSRWNIASTKDIGAIIFALVDNGWLQKQPDDKQEDFDNVFSFDEAFDQHYRIETS
ncbi:MAG: hypothetical protein JSV03_15865 [Planctomycetota bacterium]|nr:MAG: hypothetical protein JSV03_15865 [Planctomycetota bacterium]